MRDDIAWLLDGTDRAVAWVEKGSIGYNDWVFSSILCEACLLLAKKLDSSDSMHPLLIKESYRYSDIAEHSLRDEDGNVISALASKSHSDVLSQLESFSNPV